MNENVTMNTVETAELQPVVHEVVEPETVTTPAKKPGKKPGRKPGRPSKKKKEAFVAKPDWCEKPLEQCTKEELIQCVQRLMLESTQLRNELEDSGTAYKKSVDALCNRISEMQKNLETYYATMQNTVTMLDAVRTTLRIAATK